MSIIIKSKNIYKKETSLKNGIKKVENNIITPILYSDKTIFSKDYRFFDKVDVYEGDTPVWREFYETYAVMDNYVLFTESTLDISIPRTIIAKITASISVGANFGDMTYPSYLVNRFAFHHMATGNIEFSLDNSQFGDQIYVDVAVPYIDSDGQGSGVAKLPIKIELSNFDKTKENFIQENVKVSLYLPSRFTMKTPKGFNRFVVVDNMRVDLTSDFIDFSKKEMFFEGIDHKNSFSFDENIFNQTETKTNDEISSILLSKEIINKYNSGKETAKILCSISNYYDENGKKIISPYTDGYKMSFDIGDEVIPMRFGQYGVGVDIPMSRYDDRSAKAFRVCGIKFIYDGAVWQELALQEITKEV